MNAPKYLRTIATLPVACSSPSRSQAPSHRIRPHHRRKRESPRPPLPPSPSRPSATRLAPAAPRSASSPPNSRLEPREPRRSRSSPKPTAPPVEIDIDDLKPASTLGAELLTYVVWAVTPEGRSSNLGELIVNKKGDGKLETTTQSQAFSLIVTAEPYFAVHVPSEVVVLQSVPGKKTEGKIFPVASYQLMRRAQYAKMGNPLALTLDPKTPLSVYEARNAIEVAKSRQADTFAPEVYTKAEGSLQMMENSLAAKDTNAAVAAARQTVQFAEDARAPSPSSARSSRE